MKKRIIALLLAVVFAAVLLVSCQETQGTADPGNVTGEPDTGETGESGGDTSDTGETTADQNDQPSDGPLYLNSEYSAGPKVAEEYDPNAKERELKVFGASYSDNNYCAVFGECAVGALVTIKTDGQEFSVQSEGGCFAARVFCNKLRFEAEITQSYDGKVIGETLSYSEMIKRPSYDDTFSAFIGYENQGFFKKMIADFTHTNLLDDDTIKAVTERYEKRVKTLKVIDGCELIVVLAPASMTVYPELVPEEVAKPVEGESKFDQVAKALEEAGVTVIDLRENFAAHKNDALPLYYNFDSHWTEYGAYLAYVQLFEHISERFPEAAPRKFSDFNWEWGYYTRGDMPYYFDIDQGGTVFEHAFIRNLAFDAVDEVKSIQRYKYDNSLAFTSYTDQILNKRTFNTGREELPDVMVYRSSYGMQLVDILIERCNKTVNNSCFTYTFNTSDIIMEKPDYVIYIVSEWDIYELLEN